MWVTSRMYQLGQIWVGPVLKDLVLLMSPWRVPSLLGWAPWGFFLSCPGVKLIGEPPWEPDISSWPVPFGNWEPACTSQLLGSWVASVNALSHLSLGLVHSSGAGVPVLTERCGEGGGGDFG